MARQETHKKETDEAMAIQLNHHDFSTALLKYQKRSKSPIWSGPKALRVAATSGGAQRLIETGMIRVIVPKEAMAVLGR